LGGFTVMVTGDAGGATFAAAEFAGAPAGGAGATAGFGLGFAA
jgi:hypothetical protein